MSRLKYNIKSRLYSVDRSPAEIKALRKQICDVLGISNTRLSEYLNILASEKRDLSGYQLWKIAVVFKCNVQDLYAEKVVSSFKFNRRSLMNAQFLTKNKSV